MHNKISQLIFDSYKGNIPTQYTTMDKSVREEAIRQELLGVLGLEKFEKNKFRKAFRQHKAEVFAIIEDIADQVMKDGLYQMNTFFNQFVEVRNLALGDENIFYVEVRNQLEVAEFSGSHWDLKRRRVDVGQNFSLDMKNYGIKVFEEIERIMSGRADLAKLVTFVIDAVERKLALIAQATLAGALGSLPAEFVVNGSYNEAKILEVCQHVQADTGIKPTIVGTLTGLAKLQNKSDIPVSNGMAEEINNQGFLTVWNTYPCLEVAQGHKVGSFDFILDDNRLYVLTGGDKLVKICLEGTTEVEEINDGLSNADRTSEYTLQFRAGSGIAYSNMIGLIDLE